MTERWSIRYSGDLIGIEPYQCDQPWDCQCIGSENPCGFTLAECREEIAKHHEVHAKFYRSMTDKDFKTFEGYYDD